MILEIIRNNKTQAQTNEGELKTLVQEIISSSKNRIIPTSKKEADEIITVICKEKQTHSSVAILDCKKIVNSKDYANTLRTKLLLEVAEKFCQNLPMSDYLLELPGENAFSDLLVVVKQLLAKLQLKNKTDRQLLLVKNLNLLEKDERNLVTKLLMNELSGETSCQVIIFR